jgi:hypothetical protein
MKFERVYSTSKTDMKFFFAVCTQNELASSEGISFCSRHTYNFLGFILALRYYKGVLVLESFGSIQEVHTLRCLSSYYCMSLLRVEFISASHSKGCRKRSMNFAQFL